jgi:antigen flippase
MWNLLRAMILGGGASLLCTLLGAVTTKVLAVAGGPTGIGMYSLLRSMWQWATLIATLNGQISIVRNLAWRKGDDRERFLRFAWAVFIAGAVSVALVCAIFAPSATKLIFGGSVEDGLVLAVRFVGLVVIAAAVSIFLASVLSAERRMGALAITQVAGAFCTVSLAYPLAKLGHPIAFVALGLSGFVASSLVAWLAIRRLDLRAGGKALGMPRRTSSIARDYFGSAATTATTGIIGASLVLALRTLYSKAGGLETAGFFDAGWTLSTMGFALLTSSFGSYYFPSLSAALRNPDAIQKSITQMFRLATFVSVSALSLIILFKQNAIEIIYSSRFVDAVQLLKWLLISDFFKVGIFVFGMPMLSFAHNRRFLTSEILWHLLVLTIVLSSYPSRIEQAGIAVLCSNILYFMSNFAFVRKAYDWVPSRNLMTMWCTGFLAIVMASAFSWTGHNSNLDSAVVWASGVLLLVFIGTTREERKAVLTKVFSKARGIR